MKKGLGAEGFSNHYWEKNYSERESMDGIGNASQHIAYIKALFALEYVDISSIIDFGFGLGHILEEALREFIPYKAMGIEPSETAYQEVINRSISSIESTKLNLYQMDLVKWAQKYESKKVRFDLGICTSVFQYLSKEELEFVLPIMADKVKYLYFSVPTDVELGRQIEELEFKDEYAKHRSRSYYLKLLRPHFTFISSRILESKVHFNEENTFFTDLLFRF